MKVRRTKSEKRNTKTQTLIGLAFVVATFIGCNNQGGGPTASAGETPEQIRQYANALKEKELFPQAIAQYERYLDTAGGEAESRANILFVIGNLYMENLKNYEEALAAYLKITTLYPNSQVAADAQRASVTCLEKLNRSLDAQRQLNRITALDPGQAASDGSEVVAKIGDKTITMKQLDAKIQELPEPYQKSFADPEQKLEFLKNLVATDLLYTTAQRNGLDKDPEMRKRIEDMEKQILAQAVLKQEVQDKVVVSDADAKLYYDAHPEDFTRPERAKIAHILKATEKDAQELLKKLQGGADFAETAKQESLDDTTKDKGGEIGFAAKGSPLPGIGQSAEIENAVFSAKVGDMTGPFQSSRGWHLVKVIEKQPETKQSFDEAKQQAASLLRREREEEKQKELIERMMSAEKVAVYDDKFLPAGKPAPEAAPTP